MSIKKGDFIEIDYIGRIGQTNEIFDLTDAKVAEKEGIKKENTSYGPKIICVGNKDMVPGLDTFFIGKEAGKHYDLTVEAVDAFGKKNPQLIKLVPLTVFKKQKINPFPGLQVNIDGMFGIVKTASSGRVLVDFNHPLSGKQIFYSVDIKRVLIKDEEKLQHLVHNLTGQTLPCTLEKKKANITADFPEQIQKALADKIKEHIPSIEDITFVKKAKTNTQP